MQSKLTLRIDDTLIKEAKKYSKAHHKSLSQLIANYLWILTQTKSNKSSSKTLPPITKALKGIMHKKKIDEKHYKKYLEEKYQ